MKKLEKVGFFDLILRCHKVILLSLCMCGSVLLIKGQQKIIPIDAFAEKSSGTQMRALASRTSEQSLSDEQIAAFRNLYYNVQPARYYNAEGTRDAANGSYPSVLFVNPNAFSRLQADANQESNNDFSTVRLIVIDGEIGAGLPSFFTEKFLELEFLVFKSKPGEGTMNVSSTSTLISKAFWETHPNVVVVFNNLETGN